MINILKPWNFKKHIILSAFIAMCAGFIFLFISENEVASMGVIGSADGPTAVFIGSADGPTAVFFSNGILNFIYHNMVFISALCGMLVLYIPIKRVMKDFQR